MLPSIWGTYEATLQSRLPAADVTALHAELLRTAQNADAVIDGYRAKDPLQAQRVRHETREQIRQRLAIAIR